MRVINIAAATGCAIKVCGFILVMAACPTFAFATPTAIPEIDPGSMGSALALLTGGFLMLKDWRGNRRRR